MQLLLFAMSLFYLKKIPQSKFDLTLLVYSDRETQKKDYLEDQISPELAEKFYGPG